MRLIDADALNKELQKRVGSPTDDKLYEANLVIIEAPTIDAIPVEWLRNVLEEAKEFPRSEHETIVAIPYLIKRWQKEQEAR